MDRIAVTVTIDPARPEAPLLDALRQLGLEIEDRLPGTGILFGTVAKTRLPALRALDGVLEARPEDHVQLPPSDPEIPQ